MAGRANGSDRRTKLRHGVKPSERPTSIMPPARSRNAVRASRYTYGKSTSVNISAAPPRLRTSGNQ